MSAATADEACNRARAALASSPIPELNAVQVEKNSSGLVMRGVVSSFYHKQLAQETVRLVARELELANFVEVR